MTLGGRKKLVAKLSINTECWSYRCFQGIMTFLLVSFAWIFFRLDDFSQIDFILRQMVTKFDLPTFLSQQNYLFGMEPIRAFLLVVELLMILAVDILHEKKISLVSWLNTQNLVFRWLVYMIIIFTVITGSFYNWGLAASTFIYTQF